MTLTRKLAPISLAIAALALGACAQQQTRDQRRSDDSAPRASTPARPSEPLAAPTPPAASAPADRRAAPATPAVDASIGYAQFTGIPICDEYLARYKACHTVIGIVAVDQLDSRLATLRNTWQERAKDPAQRDSLTAQCQSISDEMDKALNGRDCELPESDFVEPDRTNFENVEGDSTIADE